MGELRFVEYDDVTHRDKFYDLNLEYITWVGNEVQSKYGININPNPDGSVKDYLDSVFDKFTDIRPPEGVVYLLMDDENVVGMGALRRLDDEVGEIKRMYIKPDPKFRGHGFGTKLINMLISQAKLLGFSTLRLDTGAYMPAAIHIYKKAGFMETGYYEGNEFSEDHGKGIAIYMEKKL